MTSLTLSVLLQASLITAAPHGTYDQAYAKSVESGQPLVVLVGADWCPACQTMKSSVIPQLKKQGSMNHVAFAMVNTDQQGRIANQLMTGSSIPQLILYYKDGEKWKRKSITGAVSVSGAHDFIQQGVESARLAQREPKVKPVKQR